MRLRLVMPLLTLLATGVAGRAAWAETELLQVYMRQQHAIAACADVACYRSFIRQYGSSRTIAQSEAVADDDIKQAFDVERTYAEREAADPTTVSVDRETIEGDTGVLMLKRGVETDEQTLQRPIPRYFVKQHGEWKYTTSDGQHDGGIPKD